MRVVVLSTYDLGRPPLDALAIAARLAADGHQATVHDLAVEEWSSVEPLDAVDAAVLSIPMHTAARLAVTVASRLREANPRLRVAAAGLYAAMAGGELARAVDVVVGMDADALSEWVGRSSGPRCSDAVSFPALDRYARLSIGSELRLAGAVSASSGCVHRCRHCPVPVAYDGRIRLVTVESVLGSAQQQVDAGARHLSFTDPDFFNAPAHAERVVDAVHAEFPAVTFDCTVKIEHILRHRDRWTTMAEKGCLFVVTALECLDDEVLSILDKGHTAADAETAVEVLHRAGVEVRPSLLPFTPWTTTEALADLFAFAQRHGLIHSIDPVQYTIRLLVPQGSLLVGHPAMGPHLGEYAPGAMSYTWTPAHPETTALQTRLASIAEVAAAQATAAIDVFEAMRAELRWARPDDARLREPLRDPGVPGPRMTEPWFC